MTRAYFTMGIPAVSLVFFVVLHITFTLSGPSLVYAERSSATVQEDTSTTTNTGRENYQYSALQRRHDLLDTRLHGLDSRLSAQLNTQQTQVNTRFNRIDSRLDRLETLIDDMKEYLQTRMEAMDKKVELGLTDIKPRQDGCHGEKQVSYLLPLVRGDFRPLKAPEIHKGCQEALANGWTNSGIYHITPDNNTSLDVFCEQQLDGGGWTVFQARKDGSVDFYRDWNTYKQGFGELSGEFWLGNTNINLLTKHHDQQLKIELISPEGELKYVDYSHFSIDDELHQFSLNISGYSGGSPPGDGMTYHNGAGFSTRDVDNDDFSISCAVRCVGAWWYKSCHNSNLNGLYGSSENAKGVNWNRWKGVEVSMKATRMMLRRRH